MSDRIRSELEREFAPCTVEIVDDSARHAGHAGAREGGHYRVTIVAEAFTGCPPLARHRRVYATLAPWMGRGIHALNILARTPAEAGDGATPEG